MGRGVKYGVGTYLKQLSYSLMKYEILNIFIVNYMSDRHKEIKIISELPRYTEIYIPPPCIPFKSEKHEQKYADRIVDFLIPFIHRNPYHIVHVNYFDSLWIVESLKSRFSSKVISVIHIAQWQFEYNGNKKKLLKNWTLSNNFVGMKSIEKEKRLYEISDKIITVTSYMKSFIMNYYQIPEDKLIVIYNGINISGFIKLSDKDKEVLKQSFGFRKDEKIILYAGRLEDSKGVNFLINAFIEVIEQYSNVRLVIAGDDTGKEKISQYLSQCNNLWGKITFTGFLEKKLLEKIYQIADIGVIPSIYDQCSYVALEMIGYNIPLIISDTDGLNEILKKNQAIFLNQSIDNEGNVFFERNEISNAILTLLKDDGSITNSLTYNYSNILRTRFSSDRMGKEYYLSLLHLLAIEAKT